MFNPESEASVSSAVNVVVVEDQESEFDYIRPMLERYFNDIDREFRLVHHRDAKSFLSSYQKGTDIILMDIELGEKSGMEAAQEIRRIDEDVVIIFCTKMAQFAVEGYQVNALDFLVKPFRYEGLAFRLNRAMKVLDRGRRFLLVKTKDGSQNLQLDDILYLDVFGHSLGFHTSFQTLYSWGSLGKYEEILKNQGFLRCSNSALVNAKHIKTIHGKEVLMDNGDRITISRPRHKAFLQALSLWAGARSK